MNVIKHAKKIYADLLNPLFNVLERGTRIRVILIIFIFVIYYFALKWIVIPNIACWILMISLGIYGYDKHVAKYGVAIGITLLLIGLGLTALFIFVIFAYILFKSLQEYEMKKIAKYADKTPEEIAGIDKSEIIIHIKRGDQ